MVALIVIVAVVVLGLLYLVAAYNGLVRLKNRIDGAWAQIDVQLRRRYDLIPNLVETVKGYAAHERSTFDAVTNARANAISAKGVAEQ
jgi:LemA protein